MKNLGVASGVEAASSRFMTRQAGVSIDDRANNRALEMKFGIAVQIIVFLDLC
ncbi:hypothetical protein [Thiorhodovibrio winogradskyi]|uniref:hypothetical protein n=1 Tax=Thiorhodovibrio winogradskyi TaxID=77007 RepID=UPI002E2C9572|nr:hypothetical protein [Thiorhodovibrio winogradskyi]